MKNIWKKFNYRQDSSLIFQKIHIFIIYTFRIIENQFFFRKVCHGLLIFFSGDDLVMLISKVSSAQIQNRPNLS